MVGVAYLDLTSGKVLWVVRPHMLQPSVYSEGKAMGGRGRALCLLADWSQWLGKRESYFNKILQAISLRQGKTACSFLPDAFHKKSGGKNFNHI